MACASTVAVVVPSPATSEVLEATSRTIWAPMFSSGSLRSISLATVTPSLVMTGEPNFLSRTTLRPLGPRVTLTASARRLTPRRIACRESSPYVICFAIGFAIASCQDSLRERILKGSFHGSEPTYSRGARRRTRNFAQRNSSADDREYFVLAEDEVLLAVDLDVGARVLAEEDLVSGLDVEGDLGPVLEDLAVADGDDLALLGLLLGGVRNDDPALDRLLLFDTLDDQAVVQWTNFHAKCLLSNRIGETVALPIGEC